jgi:hypothetical protein
MRLRFVVSDPARACATRPIMSKGGGSRSGVSEHGSALRLRNASRSKVRSRVSGNQVRTRGREFLCVFVALTALNVASCATNSDLASAPSGPAMAPVWQVGDEWQYAYKSPSASGTFVWSVNRIESIDGVPHYVTKSGTQEIFSRVSDLAASLVRVDGVVVQRQNPSQLVYAWPLAVGKSWEQSYVLERPVERQTTNYDILNTVDAEETITVPAGTFRTLKIVGRNRNTSTLVYEKWYAPDVKTFVRDRYVLSNGIQERELLAFKFK